MILITGATGRIGGATLKYLSSRGMALRALIRSPEKAASVAAPGVETVIGDFAEPHSLDAALEAVDAALLVSPLDPRQVELQGHFIEAAKRTGHIHIVKVSGLGTALDSPVRSGRWHAEIEQHLEDSGLPFTHLRPPFFMQNILRFAPMIRANGEFVGALQQGKVSMIDVHDIAAVAGTILTTSGHAGKAYVLTGPEALSYQEIAERISAILGRKVTYNDMPLEAMRERLRASGMPEWHVEIQIDFSTALSAGQAATVTDTVAAVTGRQPRTFEQFFQEHRDVFRH
jgi:uncharacterized protein YbjT (DUF2867 family)